MSLNIVLFEPEIPANTGNIIRTCVCTNTTLHMIRPFGFSMSEKMIKRSGMDYIQYADIRYYDSFEEYYEKYDKEKMYFFTTKARHKHSDVVYKDGDHLVFGPESRGLPEKIRSINEQNNVRIPMLFNEYVRSLNLSNSVAIGLFEALRQIDYKEFL
ncbi:MAG: tRNA (cytidine(34)-2'-O)-methyltransferase [Peptoanaerobacter stomatis]|uniref:Putative tRNA (cytidine(34)-2'-O)-methyltransferase n=1 Tax=Peptoanaerobacter stomatis TaxID=796937 RepID=G9X0P3_9FIRM|nr:tRNA (cytidine(34)-2'-O)-methyltransferase [Peptoanaerobacter stomatis]EHL15138.1 hypothetical protein HMPREF9629_01979 [Peptoanaerobacter stomatis]